MNYDNPVAAVTIGLICIAAVTAIVLGEASGMGNYGNLPDTDRNQRTAGM